MKNSLSKMSYKTKLLYILWLFLLIPIFVIYMITSVVTIHNNRKQFHTEIDAIYTSLNNDFDKIINEIDDKMTFISNFDKIQNVLTLTSKEKLSDAIDTAHETTSLFTSTFYDYGSSDICIYTTNPNIFNLPYIQSVPSELSEKFDFMPADGSFEYYFSTKKGKHYFHYQKKFTYYGDYYHILSVTMPLSSIVTPINTSATYHFFFHDKERNIVIPISSNGQDVDQASQNLVNNSIPFDYKSIKVNDGYLRDNAYILYCTRSHIKSIALIIFSFIFVLAALIFILRFIINSTARHLTSRLTKITTEILDSGGLIQTSKSPYYDEFDIIQNQLAIYSKRILEDNDKILKLELEVLNSKVSPHFLYNNLSTIKFVCDNDKIDNVVDSLVLYYRRMFHQSSAFITIENEIENINTYVELLQFAYDSNFEFILDIQKESLTKTIPGNMIQPLIENAFIHGINISNAEYKFISLSISVDNNVISISVSNTGTTSYASQILNPFDDESSDKPNSALKIIKKRLELYYSTNTSTTFTCNDNVITVQIKLPATF